MSRPHPFFQRFLLVLMLLASAPALGIEALEARNRSFRLLTEGMRDYEAGRFAEAVEKLEEVTGISLNSFQSYYYLGLAYQGLRRYEDSIASLGVALELEPGHLQSHIALGDAHLKSGTLREASVEYQPSLAFRLSSELSSRLLIAALARRWAPEALASWLLTRGLEQEPDRIRAEEAIRILTPRERDVTRLTCQGKTNHEIAYALGIARETVKSHIRSTLAKLGLHSKAELRLLVQTLDPELVQTLDPGLVQTLDPGLLQALEPWEGGSELKP